MQYVVLIDGAEQTVEVSQIEPHRYRLTWDDGRSLEVDAHALSGSALSLIVDGAQYACELERHGTHYTTAVRGHRAALEVLDLRRMRLRRAQQHQEGACGPAPLRAPMPGKVVAVQVVEGEQVQAEQGLVVIEAMKMENELRAPKAGVVRQLRASVGSAVESGSVLCVVE